MGASWAVSCHHYGQPPPRTKNKNSQFSVSSGSGFWRLGGAYRGETGILPVTAESHRFLGLQKPTENHNFGRSRHGVRRRPGPFWGRRGASWVRLGASWGRLGGGSSAHLEPSWGCPGTSWKPHGSLPGSSWVGLGPAWAVQGHPGTALEPFWGRLGVAQGPSWLF